MASGPLTAFVDFAGRAARAGVDGAWGLSRWCARKLLRGDRLGRLEAYFDARARDRRIRRGEPADLKETFDAAWHHSATERPRESIRHYAAYLDVNPFDPLAYSGLGVERLLGLGDFDGALRAWSDGEAIKARLLARYADRPDRPVMFFNEFWGIAIGHTSHLDYRIRQAIESGIPPGDRIMLAPPSSRVANRALLELWRPHMTIVDSAADLPASLETLSNLEENYYVRRVADGRMLYFWEEAAEVYERWDREGRRGLMTLPDAWRARAPAAMRALGIPEGRWHVCLHVRSPGFKTHHRLRMSSLDARIETYLPAIREIVAQGGVVVRMGDKSMPPLPPMPGVVDYAHAASKADWLDVYLCATARFFVGTSSGLGYVPALFDVPCVLTNWFPVGTRPWRRRDLYIPKRHCDSRTGRTLGVSRAFAPPLGYVHVPQEIAAAGAALVDNSPEEIHEVVLEMLAELETPGVADPALDARRLEFDRLCRAARCAGAARIGKGFLDRHPQLLE